MTGRNDNRLFVPLSDATLIILDDICRKCPHVPVARITREALRIGLKSIASRHTKFLHHGRKPTLRKWQIALRSRTK